MHVDPVIICSGIRFTVSATVLGATLLLYCRSTAKIITAVVTLAILSTSVAYIPYIRVLASTAGATNLALVTFLVPVSAIFLSILVLDESLEYGINSIGFIGYRRPVVTIFS